MGVLEELSTAPHFTKMVKSSMFATLIGWIQSLLQNSIVRGKKRQGTTSVVPKDQQKDVGL